MGIHLVGAAHLKTDIYAPTGAVMVRRGLALRGTLLPSRQRTAARYLVVTEGSLTGARITLSGQPVLIGALTTRPSC